MKVVVDDLRVFEFEALYLRSLREANAWLDGWLAEPEPVELWLDHDLDDDDDIRPFVARLEEASRERTLPIARVFLVTSNPVGATWMQAALAPFYPVQDVANEVRFRILTT